MTKPSPSRYFKTSPAIIRLAVMIYIRFPLSLRNVEDLPHERGIDICPETVRFRWNRFGPLFAAATRKRRVDGMRSSPWQWHRDEVLVKIKGERHGLRRAVDHEGDGPESLVTKPRDRKAALKFLTKTMKRHGPADAIVTDRLRSCGAARRDLGIGAKQETGRWRNNRSENSRQPFRRRERTMLRLRSMRSLQKFASVHASVPNQFNQERAPYSRQNFKANRTAAHGPSGVNSARPDAERVWGN